MKGLGKDASAVFRRITEELGTKRSMKIDKAHGVFMALCVERIGHAKGKWAGPLYSFAHYYEQNRDLMRDPEIVFLAADAGIYPLSYRQDSLGMDEEYLDLATGRLDAAKQSDLCDFAELWMRNIQEQQGI